TGTPGYTSTVSGNTTSTGGGAVVCACTVTAVTTVWPTASWIVMFTLVSAPTGAASSVTLLPMTVCATGSTALLLEYAEYGATPPTIVSVEAVPETTSMFAGRTDNAGGGVAGFACTVTATVSVWPTASCTVMLTVVSESTFAAT